MSLLRRLANGLSRREEEDDMPAMPAAEMAPAPRPQQPAPRPAPAAQPRAAAPQQRPVQQQAQPAMRPAPARPAAQGAAGQLDLTGRQAPQARNLSEEDQLEIPAFLRRQAN